MTDKQRKDFIGIAQMGIACGLEHPYEWLGNYLSHASMFEKYEDLPRRYNEVKEAFVEFFKKCGSHPYDQVHNEDLTAEKLLDEIGHYYYRKNPNHIYAIKPPTEVK